MVQIIYDKIKNPFIITLYVLLLFILITACKFYFSIIAYPKSSGISGLLSKKNIDYLFMGSSLTKYSYDIMLIEGEYHVNAYAVAYNGMSPLMASKILKYTLDNTDIHLKTVVIEAYPYNLFALPNSIGDVRLINSSPSKLKLDIIREMYNFDHDLARIYKLIVLADNETILTAPITYNLIEKLSYNGGYLNKIIPGVSKFKRNNELHDTANVSQLQYTAYVDFIDICKKHNVRIIFIEPFMPYYIQNGTNYNIAKKIIKNIITDSGNIFYENSFTSLNNNDPSLFADDIHLSTKGRELWSREIMRIIDRGN